MSPALPGREPTLHERTAGVLLHITSLPGAYGNGDLGAAAHAFAGFLAAAGLRWWQVLPLPPTGGDWSPYNGVSAFAGNPLFIALEPLVAQGWLTAAEARPPGGATQYADYGPAWRFRAARLRKAYGRFLRQAGGEQSEALSAFCADNAAWLDDYALYMALKARQGGRPWWRWPADLCRRRAGVLRRARVELAGAIGLRQFMQYLFEEQWQALRRACAARGIGLLGDLPIFVARDSADVWAHPELFIMRRDGHLPQVAGVPPDAFSTEGQRWGNPLYRWPRHQATGYRWWQERIGVALRRHTALRLDHFIGFVRYWAIPALEKTARHGRYRPGPGADFFGHLIEELGQLPLVAEDLGVVTPEVTALRERFGLPGMRVLQFAFGDGNPDNPYLPHNHSSNSVIYPGTHDNDTITGWAYQSPHDAGARRGRPRLTSVAREALAYLGRNGAEGEPVHWAMLRLALMSVGNLALLQAQDLLGLGNESRMNLPGTPRGNWRWRLAAGALTPALAQQLRALATLYGRAPTTAPGPTSPMSSST